MVSLAVLALREEPLGWKFQGFFFRGNFRR
jgi:hypothetical protein